MISITPAATIAIFDSELSPDPNPVDFGGVCVECPIGQSGQDVNLSPGASGVSLPFPIGLTTAAILAIRSFDTPDLIVTVDGVDHDVPIGQPFFLYNVAGASVTVGSVLGGKVTFVVGG